jgi:hypothetical protein
MLKLSRIRPCEYKKSCSTLHHKSTKIKFAFFWIFYDFYAFYKFQQNEYTIEVTVLRWGPWKFLQIHNHTLISHKTPQKYHRPRNVVLGHRPVVVRPNSGGRDRPGAGGEWPSGPWGSIPVFGLGRGATGELAQRSPAAVTAGPRVPANRRPMRAGLRPGHRR